jgi:transcriptional regulator with XRE-family HTH domain
MIKKLKDIRIDKHFTLSELAAKTGVSTSYLSHIENGRRRLPLKLLPAMTKALGVPEAALIEYAVDSDRDNKLKRSWIMKMEINGHPLLDAFGYYLHANPNVSIHSINQTKQELMNFIMTNLPYSITAELESNTDLLPMIFEKMEPTTTNVSR